MAWLWGYVWFCPLLNNAPFKCGNWLALGGRALPDRLSLGDLDGEGKHFFWVGGGLANGWGLDRVGDEAALDGRVLNEDWTVVFWVS